VALSADGREALVGAQFTGSRISAAYLYGESAGSWPTTPTASFIGTAGEAFGSSVALSADGRVALVGAPFASGVNGAAYLYTESAGSWPTVPTATFTGSLDQSLGSSVALSADGQVALVGGPGALLGGGTANVYTESAGRWHTGPVAAFRGGSGEGLGSSVALSGDGGVALVGADTASSTNGAAFVYTSPG
jgi:FG-GAP repeat